MIMMMAVIRTGLGVGRFCWCLHRFCLSLLPVWSIEPYSTLRPLSRPARKCRHAMRYHYTLQNSLLRNPRTNKPFGTVKWITLMVNAFNTCEWYAYLFCNKSGCPVSSLNANKASVFPFSLVSCFHRYVLTPCVDGSRRLFTDLYWCYARSDSSGFRDLFIAPSRLPQFRSCFYVPSVASHSHPPPGYGYSSRV